MAIMQRTFKSWRRPWWRWRALARRRSLVLTPDDFETLGRDSFGVELTSADSLQGEFHALDDTMAIYYDNSWVRTTVDAGDVASGDPATSERAEIDTLGIIEPVLGSSPVFRLAYDVWVPTDMQAPGGGAQLVMGQIVITSYGPPAQILWHPAGNIRVRNWVSGAFAHSVIVADADDLRGRWTRIVVQGKITKNADGWLTVSVGGIQKYSISGVVTVVNTVSDASKVYGKVGVYRTSVDTDATRGLASLWYRDVQVSYS